MQASLTLASSRAPVSASRRTRRAGARRRPPPTTAPSTYRYSVSVAISHDCGRQGLPQTGASVGSRVAVLGNPDCESRSAPRQRLPPPPPGAAPTRTAHQPARVLGPSAGSKRPRSDRAAPRGALGFDGRRHARCPLGRSPLCRLPHGGVCFRHRLCGYPPSGGQPNGPLRIGGDAHGAIGIVVGTRAQPYSWMLEASLHWMIYPIPFGGTFRHEAGHRGGRAEHSLLF